MFRKIFSLVIILFSVIGFSCNANAEDNLNNVYESRIGGVTMETRTVERTSYHRMNHLVAGQPVYGSWLNRGGRLIVNPKSKEKVSFSVSYGFVSLDLGYLSSSGGSTVGGYVLPPVSSSGRYKVVNRSLYRVTRHIVERRRKGSNDKWNYVLHYDKVDTLEERFIYQRN